MTFRTPPKKVVPSDCSLCVTSKKGSCLGDPLGVRVILTISLTMAFSSNGGLGMRGTMQGVRVAQLGRCDADSPSARLSL